MSNTAEKDPESYTLPSGVVFAMQSARPELMKLAIKQVQNGEIEPTKALVMELMRLVARYIGDVNNLQQQNQSMTDTLEALDEHMAIIVGHARKASEVIADAIE